jgi:hypothetical protein
MKRRSHHVPPAREASYPVREDCFVNLRRMVGLPVRGRGTLAVAVHQDPRRDRQVESR